MKNIVREEFCRKFSEWVQDELDGVIMQMMHDVLAAQPENDKIFNIRPECSVELIISYWEADA